MLNTVLTKFKDEYLKASSLVLKDNKFANYTRTDAIELVENVLQREDLKVSISVGQGNWAEIPWIGIFNPEITETATAGIYVVYLFSADMRSVYLCQGQGVTSVKNEFGKGYRSELLRRSDLIRSRVPDYSSSFNAGEVDLLGTTTLAKSYESAVAYFKHYQLDQLPTEDTLQHDLSKMIGLYDQLVMLGGTDNIETFSNFVSDESPETIEEQRRYVRHSRIERNPKAAAAVKKILGNICMGCGFDFKRIYGARGADYIEAHHLTALHELPTGKAVSMNTETDFAVLCANCHRMIHRKKPMLTLEELQSLKGVKMLRKAFSAKN
jgi:5-methylcytosine-specific restriction enzyme A